MEKKRYAMLVFSQAVEGGEDEYLRWYSGQHIHDLLRIPGFTGCRFYRVSESQLFGTKEDKQHQYLMIWEWETEDVNQIFHEIEARKKDGRSVLCPMFTGQYNIVCMPVTEWITSEEIAGLNVEQVADYTRLVQLEKKTSQADRSVQQESKT